MAKFGTIAEFDSKAEEWTEYSERIKNFFIANDIADGKRVAVLLSTIGADPYKLIKNLTSPDIPSDKTFNEIDQLLKAHYTPRKSVIVGRFHFNSRAKKSHETINEYVAELRSLAKDCNFGAQMDYMLRDRLVVGANDKAIQRRLLSESDDLTFARALELAQSLELADRNVQALARQESQAVGVNKVTRHRPTSSSHSSRGMWCHFLCALFCL